MLAIEISTLDGELTHVRSPLGASICGLTEPGIAFSPGRWDPPTCPECKSLKAHIHAIGWRGKQLCNPNEVPSFYTSTIVVEDVTCQWCIKRIRKGFTVQPRRAPVAQFTPEARPSKMKTDGRSPLAPAQVRAICLLYEHGFAVADIGRRFKVTRQTIYNIVEGKTYRYVARPIYKIEP